MRYTGYTMAENQPIGTSAYAQRAQTTKENAQKGLNMYGQPIRQPSVTIERGVSSTSQSTSGVWQKGKNARIRTIDAAAHSSSMKKDAQNRERAAAKRANVRAQNRAGEETATQKKPKKASAALKGGYILFFLVLGLSVIKDISDIIFNLLTFGGTALSATLIGAPIGIPLLIFSEATSLFLTMFTDGTSMLYFWFTGGKLGVRLAIMSVGAIIDAVPGLGVLPITTITFVLAFLAGRAISKVESKVGGGLVTSAIAKKI